METDFNFKVNENVKIYTSMEAGVGLGVKINTNGKCKSKNATYERRVYLFKGSFGTKINDKYNIGFYGSMVGKGVFGLELGYTFK
ncbi:hypothetical protein [Streptobacillus ratti]